MFTAEFGDMWSVASESDYFCITTNSYLRKDGCLVMGRGIANQALVKFPNIGMFAGGLIRVHAICKRKIYSLLLFENPWSRSPKNFGLFRVKDHFRDAAKIPIIRESAESLREIATTNSDARFDLNFPGIGYGRLDEKDVVGILRILPPNVHIWRYEHEQDKKKARDA